MPKTQAIVQVERIESRIQLIRGQKVMVDSDLAELYGVNTKRLNEQVKRNQNRFPADFMFKLTAMEKAEVVANCHHLQTLKFSPGLPNTFTEHGAIMVASVLNTPLAIEVSVYVVRTFVKLREMLGAHRELAGKLAELEGRVEAHDENITALFEAIRQLMHPPRKTKEADRLRGGKQILRSQGGVHLGLNLGLAFFSTDVADEFAGDQTLDDDLVRIAIYIVFLAAFIRLIIALLPRLVIKTRAVLYIRA
jgi:hypothetical protein